MDRNRFHELCLEASRLAVTHRDRIGNLRLTQKNERGEPIIREPEMVHAFCRTLDGPGWQTPYGIEVPTQKLYRFVDEEGEKTIRARHDLVLFEGAEPDVLVELKTGQPAASADGDDHPAISKDLRKLLLEKAPGKAMFHICHASDRGTLPAIIKKYEAALAFTMARIEELGEMLDASAWFDLYVLVLYDRKEGGQPYLHRYTPPHLGEGFAPVFHPDQDGKGAIPRG